MDALFPRSAGLDVHNANVAACVRVVGPTGKVTKQVRTFSTVTNALGAPAEWLFDEGARVACSAGSSPRVERSCGQRPQG
jgi:hypothetical protein